MLENATAENSTTHLFHLNNASTDRAQELLEGRSIDALIIIPKNFSTAFATMVNNSTRTVITSSVGQQALSTGGNASLGAGATVCGANVVLPKAGNVTPALQIQGDTGYVNFATSEALITGIFAQCKSGIQANATARAAPDVGNSVFKDFIPTEMIPIARTQSFSLFDYTVPGLIVFALLLQMSLVASSLVRDVERDSLIG